MSRTTFKKIEVLPCMDFPSVLLGAGTAFSSYSCRANLGFVAASVTRALGISCSQYGLLSGVFYLSYMLFMVPSTLGAQRWGALPWIGWSVVIWGFVCSACAFAGSSYALFLAIRLGLGVVQSGTFPSIMQYLSAFHSPTHMGTAYSVAVSAVPLAQIISPLLVALIDEAAAGGALGLAAWQWVFLVDGAISVIFGLLVLVIVSVRRRRREDLGLAIEASRESPFVSQGSAVKSTIWASYAAILRDRRAWYLATIFFLVDQVIVGWIFFIPLIVSSMFGNHDTSSSKSSCAGDDTRLADTKSILLSAIPFFAAMVGNWVVAWSSDRMFERRWHATGSLTIASVLLFWLAFLDHEGNSIASFILLVMGSAFTNGYHGPVVTWPNDFARSADEATRIFALCNACGCIGASLGPVVFGLLETNSGGYTLTFLYNSVCVALAAVLVAFFKPERSEGHAYTPIELATRRKRDDRSPETAAILAATSIETELSQSLSRRRSSRQRRTSSLRQLSV